MKITTYQFEKGTVRIHDPAETPEAKARQHERIEKACIRFMTAVERERARACVKG